MIARIIWQRAGFAHRGPAAADVSSLPLTEHAEPSSEKKPRLKRFRLG